MSKAEELEAKIHKIIERLADLKKDNSRLRTECESLKGHVTLLTGENTKAQQILADYEQLRRKQDQVTHRVERALSSLNALRSA
jgi:ATP/maltotriose-dependent transcriptional regulator MalT